MKELSLNILDITENSVKARATLTEISLIEDDKTLTIIIKDNGCGMSEDIVNSVTNPFYTTRTTRNVGLGIPLFKMAAEQTGGGLEILSIEDDGKNPLHGTTVKAYFFKNHIDYTPLGDIVTTLTTLIHGHPDVDFLYTHKNGENEVRLDTRELREVLEEVPLNSFEVLEWIKGYLLEQYNNFKKI